MTLTSICRQCSAEFTIRKGRKNFFCSQQCYGANNRVDHVAAFWNKVVKTPGCWAWTGARGNHGYPVVWDGVRVRTGHRFAWELHNGDIPNGMHVLHSCDNRECTNPDHLFLGTNNDNIADRVSKGRSSHSHGLKGESHPFSKITDSDVIAIRQMRRDGILLRVIGNQFGVTATTIGRIVHRDAWKHIP